mmetsp:Transcript_15247/g.22514  ORF Transcript_15247/g.22514 Transcript_15247/m.22514 type:complete len:163 (+) Transcript_15247:49-537(+)
MSSGRSISLMGPSIFSGLDEMMSSPFPIMGDMILPTPFLTAGAESDAALRRSSPCYEITEDENQFQLAVDVPGVKATDIKVNLEQGNRVLHISGGRNIKQKGKTITTHFEKSFTIDHSVDASAITANVSEGVLIVTAPKDKKFKEAHTIEVTTNPHQVEGGK